jgi:hypothetical protein
MAKRAAPARELSVREFAHMFKQARKFDAHPHVSPQSDLERLEKEFEKEKEQERLLEEEYDRMFRMMGDCVAHSTGKPCRHPHADAWVPHYSIESFGCIPGNKVVTCEQDKSGSYIKFSVIVGFVKRKLM